jgi:hypothetical protein
MIPKGYRLSFSHLFFYITTFVIATQLWSIWRQSTASYTPDTSSDWVFNADVHANIHTLASEQCDSAFPELYHSLDNAVSRRAGRKVHIQDIEIAEGRCMLRVMIYQGEVRAKPTNRIFSKCSLCIALRSQLWKTRRMLRYKRQRKRAHSWNTCSNRPRNLNLPDVRLFDPEYRVLALA